MYITLVGAISCRCTCISILIKRRTYCFAAFPRAKKELCLAAFKESFNFKISQFF
jgi:hypothetical protein